MSKNKDERSLVEIEKSIVDQLNKYPWGNLFKDDTGGFLSGLLPWINLALLIVVLVLMFRK